MVKLTGAEALVRALLPERVPFVFGVASGKLNGLLHAVSREPSMRYVGVRHEASGALMGAAVAAASGRTCLALGEMGPGSSNLVGGVGTAFNNSLPLILVTSNNHQAASYPNRGMFMETNTHALFKPVTKWSAVVHEGARIPELVRTALREALTGRRGPVHLDVPQEMFTAVFEYEEAEFEAQPASYRVVRGPRPAAELVAEAADRLARAERPLLVAGGGVVAAEATDLFRDLAARLGSPATTTQMGLGVVPTTSPFFIGHGGIIGGPAVPEAFRRADAILAVGCRFSSWLWDERGALTGDGRQLINVNIDPASLGGAARHAVGIWADAGAALADLGAAVAERPRRDRSAWLDEMTGLYAGYRATLDALAGDDGTPMHPATLAREIAAFVPDDALIAYDGGHTTFWSNDFTPASEPRTRFHEPGMCQLGFGTPYAIALQLLHPNRPVLNLIGDGSFGFTIAELDTARRYGLPIVNVIHNNASWGIIERAQRKSYDFSLGTDLSGTSYAEIARGFGCHGEVVTAAGEVRPALRRAFDSGLPAVVDCRVRFEAHPCLPAFGRMNAFGFPRGSSAAPHASAARGG